jgi:hypothetical protein
MDSVPFYRSEAPHQRKTTLRTFRFSEELTHALEAEAEDQGLTLNALVSSILTRHIEWDTRAAKFGYIPVYKPMFTWLLQTSDEESLSRLGRTLLPAMWKEMASFWFQDSSEERILDLLSIRSRYLPFIQTEVKREGRKHTIVTHHDLCPNWSIVMRSAYDELVRTSFHAQPTIVTGQTVVTVEFSIP